MDIPLARNEAYAQDWVIRAQQDDSGHELTPIDITGWTFSLQVRERLDNDTLVQQAIIEITDPAAGEINVLLDAESGGLGVYGDPLQSVLLPYDFRATDTDGISTVLARGNIYLQRGLSKMTGSGGESVIAIISDVLGGGQPNIIDISDDLPIKRLRLLEEVPSGLDTTVIPERDIIFDGKNVRVGDGVTQGGRIFKADDKNIVFAEFYQTPGATDWTVAINTALATGKHVMLPSSGLGSSGLKVTDALTFVNSGQRIIADAPVDIYVQSDFNMSAAGVLVWPSTRTGAYGGRTNVGVYFEQPPAATLRSQLIQYPWAVVARGTERPRTEGYNRISGGWNGVDMSGPINGGDIGVSDIGAINIGLLVDGCADFLKGSAYFWPHGFDPNHGGSASLLAIWGDGGTIGFNCGRCDGLELSIAGFQTRHVFFSSLVNTGYAAYGIIPALSLDGNYSRIEGVATQIDIGSMYGGSALTNDFMMQTTGGVWNIGQANGFSYPGGTVPQFSCSAGRLSLVNVNWNSGSADAPFARATGGILRVEDAEFNYGTNTTRTAGYLEQVTGKVSFTNLRFAPIGTGSGPCVVITTDDTHDVDLSLMNGWTATLPATLTNGDYTLARQFTATAPTTAFATPGNYAPTYTTQACTYRITRNRVFFDLTVTFTSNAYTTASGDFRINPGIPYSPSAEAGLTLGRIDNIAFTSGAVLQAVMGTDGLIHIRETASGAAVMNWGTAQVPAGGAARTLSIVGSYHL